jgi:hypothetical protein
MTTPASLQVCDPDSGECRPEMGPLTSTVNRSANAGSRSRLLALGLFLLAPLVAEFLLGNLPITALYALVVLAPLYGGGALLIREIVRRTGHGWPSIVALALAYGVLEEGVTTMSLFNPNYAGERLLDYGYIPVLGIGGPWTVFVLMLHTIWSISVPIAIMEVLACDRRATPWLGRVGLALTTLLFVFGVAASTLISIASFSFVASVPQLAATLLVTAALVFGGLVLKRPALAEAAASTPPAPKPWLVGAATLAASSAFKQLPREGAAWLYVGAVLVLVIGSLLVVHRWSRQPGWG